MILEILNRLAATTKRTEKEAILKSEKDNELLKRVFELAYTPTYQFNMKKLPDVTVGGAYVHEYQELDTELERVFSTLVLNQMRGHAAQDFVAKTLASVSEDDAEVIRRVILKDLRTGCTGSTANKIWKGLIAEQPQMLASSFKEKLVDDILKKEAFAELKADGARCFAHIDKEGNITFTSRNGKQYTGLIKLEREIAKLNANGFVIDGELVYAPNGLENVEDRSTGNGIVNKASKGTITAQEQADIVFQVWDIIPDEVYFGICKGLNSPYRLRKQFLADLVVDAVDIEPIPWHVVHTKEEAGKIYAEYVAQGLEGIILKDPDALWENKRSKSLVKFKEVHDGDLEIIEVLEGDKKNKGKLGALLLRSACGRLITKVGSGFTDKDREEMWERRDELIGMIVEINYNAITRARNKDTWSCFLPIFVKIRDDKDVANTLDEMSGFNG
ncbi:DNA ligase [Vibrio phage nt-1]|uniref:DNA ligase n=1 Tax=Vibrio phage nt-1 TaxID=115992 RepID=R9TED3_9CAUD|nr:ATP-dependent DNA ligase [Vibrio phage nt-1]AGN30106.1 DNA ligase [Vibrio phage nt-1]